MHIIQSRIRGASLNEEVDCLIHMAQEEMAHAQTPILALDGGISRIEPNGFLNVWNSCVWPTHPHKDRAKQTNRARVIAVECYRPLELDLRLSQAVLHPSELTHHGMRHRIVRIPPQDFSK